MNSVEGGLSQEQLETQARTEWISRGFPADDFTFKAMQQVWKQEKSVTQNATANQQNKLAEKMAAIQRSKDRALLPSKAALSEMVKDGWSSAKVSAKATAARLARSLELPFMKRARLQREHLERVLQQHTRADDTHQLKEEARKTRRLERIHELAMDKKNKAQVTGGAPFRAHLKNLEDTAASSDKALRDQAKKDSRQAYIDGVHAAQALRRKQQDDRKAAHLRRSRAKADREYKLKAKDTKEEHTTRSTQLSTRKNHLSIKKQHDFQVEQQQYAQDLHDEEMSFPQVSSASGSGGIFGTPNEPGSFHRDGRVSGQDEYTVTGGSILNQGTCFILLFQYTTANKHV